MGGSTDFFSNLLTTSLILLNGRLFDFDFFLILGFGIFRLTNRTEMGAIMMIDTQRTLFLSGYLTTE